MIGWIKLHRSLTEHWIYNERRKFSKLEAWIDILMTVNYEDKKVLIKGKLYDVKRGQSILSLDSWAKRWNWDKSAVRRLFNLLQNDSMIEIISDNITTHITVCKYDSYQGIENADETQTKRKRNSNENQTTLTKEDKEDKEINKIDFSVFWNLYDKKKDTKNCIEKWNKLKPLEQKQIIDCLPKYIKETPDKKYRKNPSSFLNQNTWLDYLENDISIERPSVWDLKNKVTDGYYTEQEAMQKYNYDFKTNKFID
jgi:hypothetical protein